MKDKGVKKGDRVTIYLPMIPEAAYAMLACARLGAIHSVVFGGFSPDSLADRINGAEAKLVITCDGGLRGGRAVPLKENCDKALEKCPSDVKVLMFRHVGITVPMTPTRSGQCRGSPLHPLHLGLDRHAQGRPPYVGRLSRLRGPHPPIRVRLP
jgi:acetyl-CoA synthetase